MTINYGNVETEIGRPILDGDEQAQVTQWIADVEMLLGVRLGDLTGFEEDLTDFVVRKVVASQMRHRAEFDNDTGTEDEQLALMGFIEPWLNLFDTAESSQGFSIRPGFDADTTQWSIARPGEFDPEWGWVTP